ncbi:MAG: flagellar biosynthetic protein FliR [Armatimonadota bacterium]
MTMDLAAAVAIWGLVFARTAGVALLVPPTGHRQVPVSVRLGAASVVAVALVYVVKAPQAGEIPLAHYTAWALGNLVVGLVIGAAVAAVLYGAVMAGNYLDNAAAWSAQPIEQRPVGRLFYLLAAGLFLLIDGHHAVIRTLAQSFGVFPAAGDITQLAQEALVVWPTEMLAGSVLIAAPALLAVLLARAMLASVERMFEELRQSGLSAAGGSLLTLVVVALTLPAVSWTAVACLRRALRELGAMLG